MPEKPTILTEVTDLFVQQMNIPKPFPLQELINIQAVDWQNNNISNTLYVDNSVANFAVPNTYEIPITATDRTGNSTTVYVALHVLSRADAATRLPKVQVLNPDLYVYRTDQLNPYNLALHLKIRATDHYGQDIANRIIIMQNHVNFKISGTYIAIIQAMDTEGNLTLASCRVHVVNDNEIQQQPNNTRRLPGRRQKSPSQNLPAATSASTQISPTSSDTETKDAIKAKNDHKQEVLTDFGLLGVLLICVWQAFDMFG